MYSLENVKMVSADSLVQVRQHIIALLYGRPEFESGSMTFPDPTQSLFFILIWFLFHQAL